MAIASAPLDLARIRADFPILARTVHGKPLVYLDNAASAQMPACVIERVARYQREEHANVHRGVHTLSHEATTAYEDARETVRSFLNIPTLRETIFTRGTTEAMNLVAHSFGRTFMHAGDIVLLSAMEHHANIVPWQLLREERGIEIRVIPMDDRGVLDLEAYERLLDGPVKLVGVAHVSNALGTINPVAEMTRLAHARGIPVLVDGAQAVPHLAVDVQALGCDFYAFSGHKLGGPTGSGALYGKASWLERMRPYMGGGDMIVSVRFEETVYNDLPYRFEAGTPAIAPQIGLAEAIRYLRSVGLDQAAAHEHALLERATELVGALPGVRLIGTAPEKASVLSFVMRGVHPHDVGSLLDEEGIAVRVGHHCAQPVMERFGVPATVRASFAYYNTLEEVEALARGLRGVQEVFGL
jgi:cysteine desulfurase/selenocysteine lyase